jgi:hypothetical protein
MAVGACVRINAPQVISEVIDGEAVIVNLETGAYYSIQGAGSLIWELIETGASAADMLARLVDQYASSSAEIRSPLLSFLNELREEGLIEFVSPVDDLFSNIPASGVGAAGGVKLFDRPMLAKYTDMADLLLLDPIHEVDETGWPEPKPAKQV